MNCAEKPGLPDCGAEAAAEAAIKPPAHLMEEASNSFNGKTSDIWSLLCPALPSQWKHFDSEKA